MSGEIRGGRPGAEMIERLRAVLRRLLAATSITGMIELGDNAAILSSPFRGSVVYHRVLASRSWYSAGRHLHAIFCVGVNN